MSERSVRGLFINPAHQRRMMPAKYASIMMDIKISSSVSRCDWDSVLSLAYSILDYYKVPVGLQFNIECCDDDKKIHVMLEVVEDDN